MRSFEEELIEVVPVLRSMARKFGVPSVDIEDLVQSTLLKAWEAKERYRDEGHFRAWIITIMRNRFYSDRRKCRETAMIEEYEWVANADNPETVVYLGQVIEKMDCMSQDQRDAVIDQAIGLSIDESAKLRHTVAGTVKSRRYRGHDLLVEMCE